MREKNYVLVLDPDQSSFNQFKDILEDGSLKHFGSDITLSFLHAKNLREALSYISRLNGSLMLTCINPSMAATAKGGLDCEKLLAIENKINQALSNDAESIFVGEPEDIKQIPFACSQEDTNPAPQRLISSSNAMLEQVLRKMDEILAKRTSGGSGTLNIQVMRFETALHAIQRLVEGHESRLDKLEHLLWIRTGVTASPPLVEVVSDLQRLLNRLDKESSEQNDDLHRLQQVCEALQRHINELHGWKNCIESGRKAAGKRRAAWVDQAISVGIATATTLIVEFIIRQSGIE